MGTESAVERWKNRVEAHHEQSLRVQEQSPDEDYWRPLASLFKDDPRRTGDPILDRLFQGVTPVTTVLDVGGGAGRYALPLALRCRHVTVAEPSESMVEALRAGAQEAGIDNLTIVQEPWEEAEVDRADRVLCAHVVYGIAEIQPFVRKLESHAGERVLILAFTESPLSQLSPLWKPVHGEDRIDLPALPEILSVLWEMEIYPDLEMFEAARPQAADSRDAAQDLLRRFLYVKPGTEADERLQAAMREMIVETPDGVVVRGSRPRRQGLISWTPE